MSNNAVIRNKKMVCLACGIETDIPLPIEVQVFAAMAAAFDGLHKHCEPKQELQADSPKK